MLLEKRQSRGEHPKPLLGRVDPLPQRLVLRLQVDHPQPGFLELGPGDDAAAGLRLLQLGLGLERAAPPRRQLFGQVLQDPLQIGQGRQVGPIVGVCHAHPPVRDPPSRRWIPNSAATAASSRASASSTSLSRSVLSGARNVSRNATLRVAAGSSAPR